MNRDQVIPVLESLANGVDPATGTRIPLDAFHTADTVRALFAAATLLRENNTPPKEKRTGAAGSRWTEEEDALLAREFDSGTAIAEIARGHGRTPAAINLRLVKLGKIDAVLVTPRTRSRA
ncbi:MAG TPA: hypothetical protein VF883_24540 [Thermoanaerobaculia bacterium]|jgi:hypothetical protein